MGGEKIFKILPLLGGRYWWKKLKIILLFSQGINKMLWQFPSKFLVVIIRNEEKIIKLINSMEDEYSNWLFQPPF